MVRETFHGPTLSAALARVRAKLGDDALILRSHTRPEGGVEVLATTAAEIDRFRARLEREPLRLSRPGAEARPHVLALVGPTGAGKTTTAVKLALHPDAFGGRSVGLLTLDTYRVGALEELSLYAGIANLPLEVVYGTSDVAGALARLAHCEVVIVDTPGRSPSAEAAPEWRALLRRLAPDEVHLVLPAGLRHDVALWTRDAFASCGPTHSLLTKLDEVPGEEGVAELADSLHLPARWVTAGQDVPAALHRASPRLLSALCRDQRAPRRRGLAG